MKVFYSFLFLVHSNVCKAVVFVFISMLFPVLAHALFTARVVRTCSSRNAWASPMNSNQSGLVIEANQPNVTAVDFFFEKSSKLSLIVWPAFYDFDDHFECVCACVFCLHTLLQHASESKL